MKKRPHILMYMQNYYSVELHKGIAQYAMEAGWSLNATMYRRGELPTRNWDGIVGTFEVGDRNDYLDSFIKSKQIPTVSLTVSKEYPSVLPDNRAIGQMAAEHLLDLGYRNFAFYFWQSKYHETTRSEALRSRLNPDIHKFYRINYKKRPRVRRQGAAARLRILRRFLADAPKPVAIMAPLDDFAVEVIEVCGDMGLRVPRDVGVIGVNNDRLICNFTPIPLTSIDDDEYRIGYEGAALLNRIMRKRKISGKPIFVQPKKVQVRKSTDLLDLTDVDDRQVAIAVRYIAKSFTKPIKVDDIVRQTGISKRPLQDRFLKHIGKTIHEQIVYKRIDHAKQLLGTTDYKTSYIALECGFGSRESFSKSFKQTVGLSPKEFRENELLGKEQKPVSA